MIQTTIAPPKSSEWKGAIVNCDVEEVPLTPQSSAPPDITLDSAPPAVLIRKAVLEVVSPNPGHRDWLLTHQLMSIGRTNEADISFPDDKEMSHVHFTLYCDWNTCRLEDLKSANGTFVNGNRVDTSTLKSGDRIRAGHTVFRLTLFGDSDEPLGSGPTDARECGNGLTQTVDLMTHVPVSIAACQENIARYSPVDSTAQLSHIAFRLSQNLNLYLVADFEKLGCTIPEDIDKPDYLIDWVPEEVAIRWSPIVIAAHETTSFWKIIEDGWGKDSLLCMFSNLEKDEFMHLLRAVARGEPAQSELSRHPERLVGYYTPNTLASLIANGPPKMWRELFSGCSAILMEADDSWEIYALEQMEEQFRALGFVPALSGDESPVVRTNRKSDNPVQSGKELQP